MTKGVCCSVLSALTAVALCACTEGRASAKETIGFPVNDTISADLEAKGIPPDIARFFAAVKFDSKCPNDTTCVYLQTFPTGATREITLRVSPNQQRAASDQVTPGSAPIYGFKYASNFAIDPAKLDLNYYVEKAGLPDAPARTSSSVGLVRLASLTTPVQSSDGAGIYWGEVGKKGADAAIGAMIDLAKDKGVKVGPLGSIYSLASALSDVSAAMDLGKQNTKWLNELDALEKCAANPTNQVSRSDPSYSRNTVAKLQAARSELKEVNSVRFLNQMTEKGADLTPVTAVMAVGLKQGFAWSEQTLGDYSENTIMREARAAVVKCGDPGNPAGNLDLLAECQFGPNDHTVTHITANVSWEWQMGVKYLPRGNYTFSSIRKVGSSCTITSTAAGSIDDTGYLFVFDDPARQKELGYGYEARFVNWPAKVTIVASGASNCGISTTLQQDVDWIPTMHGYRGTGGDIEGVMPGPACNPGQPSTLKWAFNIPPSKK
jgi:hypothetical protein